MPGGTRRRLYVVFYRDGFDIVVQGQVLNFEWELPEPRGLERHRKGGVTFGPPFPNEGQDTSNPFVMVGMPMGNDDFRDVWELWVGYHSRFSKSRFEDGNIMVPTLSGVHQDVWIVSSDEISV